MFNLKWNITALVFVLMSFLTTNACSLSESGGASGKPSSASITSDSWTKVTESAAYPVGYSGSTLVPEKLFAMANILFLGLLLGYLLKSTGSLWSCFILHAINNLAAIILFG